MKSIQKEQILRLNCPGFGEESYLTIGKAKPLAILRVVDKFLLQLESQLAEKKVEVTFTDALRKHLGKKDFDPLMGARPMQRLIQDTIRRALADELLFGRLVDGGRLTVDVDAEGQVLLDIQPARKSDKPKAEPATAA